MRSSFLVLLLDKIVTTFRWKDILALIAFRYVHRDWIRKNKCCFYESNLQPQPPKLPSSYIWSTDFTNASLYDEQLTNASTRKHETLKRFILQTPMFQILSPRSLYGKTLTCKFIYYRRNKWIDRIKTTMDAWHENHTYLRMAPAMRPFVFV